MTGLSTEATTVGVGSVTFSDISSSGGMNGKMFTSDVDAGNSGLEVTPGNAGAEISMPISKLAEILAEAATSAKVEEGQVTLSERCSPGGNHGRIDTIPSCSVELENSGKGTEMSDIGTDIVGSSIEASEVGENRDARLSRIGLLALRVTADVPTTVSTGAWLLSRTNEGRLMLAVGALKAEICIGGGSRTAVVNEGTAVVATLSTLLDIPSKSPKISLSTSVESKLLKKSPSCLKKFLGLLCAAATSSTLSDSGTGARAFNS